MIKNYNDSPHAYGKFQERYDSIEVPSAACSLFTQTLRKLLPFVGQNNAVLTFSSARHLCLHSKWQTVMDITDVYMRKNVTKAIFCLLNGNTFLRV